MQILVNGEKRQLERGELTISALLEEEKVESPEMVAVQVNGEIVDRGQYDARSVNGGDEIDFLYFMGGGSR